MGIDSKTNLHKSVPLKTALIAYTKLLNPTEDIENIAEIAHDKLKKENQGFAPKNFFIPQVPIENKEIGLSKSPSFFFLSNMTNYPDFDNYEENKESVMQQISEDTIIDKSDYSLHISTGFSAIHVVCMKHLADLLGGFVIYDDSQEEIGYYNIKPKIPYEWHNDPDKLHLIKEVLDNFELDIEECYKIIKEENIDLNTERHQELLFLIKHYESSLEKKNIENEICFNNKINTRERRPKL